MASQPMPTTIASALWPSRGDTAGVIRMIVLAFAGTLLLTLSAKLKVPFYPVPMTMQTLVVLAIGAAYGSRLGAATVALYLLEGALGLPVFADTPERGIGLAYMMGPTGGFLLGFVAGAWISGVIAESGFGRSIVGMFAAMTIGHVAIFVCGFAWLATLIGTGPAWMGGVAPFLAAPLGHTLAAAPRLSTVCRRVDGPKA